MTTKTIVDYLKEHYQEISFDKSTKTFNIDGEIFGPSELNSLKQNIAKDLDVDVKTISVSMIRTALKYIEAKSELEKQAGEPGFQTEEWMRGMDMNDKGRPIDSSLNNMKLFDQHPDFVGKLYYDEVTKHEIYDGEELDDVIIAKLKTDIETALGGNRSIVNAKTAALSYCKSHPRNKLKENLLSLRGKWDGIPRLENLFVKAYECDDSPYIHYVTKVMFYAWINRMLNPGCIFDSMFVFEGKQGIGKSKFLMRMIKLIGGQGTENMKFDFDRNNLDKFSTYQLCQSEELRDMKKAELASIKDLIARTCDTVDRKFRDNKIFQRTCILVGNVNPEEKNFLRDLVDYERRFIIFPCHAEGFPNGVRADGKWWDENFSDEYLLQVWAEALYLVENEPDFRWISLPAEHAEVLQKIQSGYKFMLDDDVFLEKLYKTLELEYSKEEIEDYNEFVIEVENSTLSSFKNVNKKRLMKIDKGVLRRYMTDVMKEKRSPQYFRKAMEKFGWVENHTTRKGRNIYQYVRKNDDEQIKLELQ